MRARVPALFVVVAILLPAPSLPGQSSDGSEQAASRTRRPLRRSRRGPFVRPPAESTAEEPGSVTPPRQGYVVLPKSPPAGTAGLVPIPEDPLDLAYWELYDPEKRVTLTGKITKVDWDNPNSYIYLTASGTQWAIESSFIQFRQSSVTPAVRVDEVITVLGYLPRDEPAGGELPGAISPVLAAYLEANHLIRAGEITTVFGQKLNLGEPPSEDELAKRLKCSALGC